MSEPTLRLKSVKYDEGAIEIQAVETHQATPDVKEITLRSSEEPRTEFLVPLIELQRHVRKLIEVDSQWAEGELSVKKVVWSFSEATGVRGGTICCQAKLDCADAPLVFNTPHLPFDQYSEGGNAPVMPKDVIALFDTLEAEALLFLDGKRAQGDLFDSEPARRIRDAVQKGEMTIEVVK
jgi:hypothetical protein